ncbi:DUF2341 domain-containing protein, partial [archaeon]|nr:DUF2341 domain-containing protein [archaeon]
GSDLNFGGYSGGYNLDGTIDEPIIIDQALNAEEIKSLFYAQKAEFIEYSEGYEGKGAGLFFDGDQDHVNCGDNPDLDGSSFTLSAWVKPESLSSNGFVLFKGDWVGTSRALHFGFRDADTFTLAFYYDDLDYDYAFETDKWYHIVGRYDTATNTQSIFVNGEFKTSRTTTYGDLSSTNDDDLEIGRGYYGSYTDRGFNGVIDEVRVYTRPLSDEEISGLYDERKGRYDYADLRFINESGQELNYFHEYDDKVWVRSNLQSSSDTDIKMYHGNPGANSRSNGDLVFEFFDDFEDGGYSDKWTVIGGTWIENNGFIKNTALTCGVDLWQGGLKSIRLPSIDERIISSKIKIITGENSYAAYSSKYYDDGNLLHSELRNEATNVLRGHARVSDSWMTIHDQAFTINENVWYELITKVDGSGNVEITVDGTTNSFTDSDWDQTWTAVALQSCNTEVYFDDFYVRKYASTEPTVTIGSQESVYGNDTGLVSYYSFDNDEENKTVDSIGKNHGSLYGNTVGLYHMDEYAGSIVADATSYGNDGSFGNTPVWVSGISGNALSFSNTSNEYLLVPDDLSLDITRNLTLSAWIKGFPITGTYQILGKQTSSGGGYSYALQLVDGRIRFGVSSTGSDWIARDSDIIIYDADQWHHVVGVYDGSDTHIYIDRLLSDGTLSGTVPSSIYSSSTPLLIGARGDGTTRDLYFNGVIDEPVVYNKALTADEIDYLYDSQRAEFMDYSSGHQGKNKGAGFDGVDDYVRISEHDSLDFTTGDFSVTAWFKTSADINEYQVIFSKDDDDPHNANAEFFMFEIPRNGATWGRRLYAHLADGDGVNEYAVNSSVEVTDGAWHHGVAVVDLTNLLFKIYLDGDLHQTKSLSGFDGFEIDRDSYIGADGSETGPESSYFNGVIDEVRVYNRALSPEEISELYNSTNLDYGCCGDDLIYDDFYTGLLSSTANVCFNNTYYHTSLDVNQGLCSIHNYSWIENAGGGWWDEDYDYRQRIIIVNPQAEAQQDYAVNLTIDTSSLISQGRLQNDCGDLRFVNTSGVIYPYWVESGCGTTQTRVWVTVRDLPASSNTTMFIYYGNPAADNGFLNNDGSLTVSSGTFYVDKVKSTLSESISAGDDTISLTSSSGFSTDDEVIIIKMNGTDTGVYELGVIRALNNKKLRLSHPVRNNYDNSDGVVLVQKVPHYSSVTVNGGTLTASPWSGSGGGLVAFKTGTLTVSSGSISANELGYYGGVSGSHGPQNSTTFSILTGGCGGGGGQGGWQSEYGYGVGVGGTGSTGYDGSSGTHGGDSSGDGSGGDGGCSTAGGGGGGGGYGGFHGANDQLGGSGHTGDNNGEDGSGYAAGGGAARDGGGGGGGGYPYDSGGNDAPSDLTKLYLGGGGAAGAGGAGAGGSGDCDCGGGDGGDADGDPGAAGGSECSGYGGNPGTAGSSGNPGGGIIFIESREITVTGSISANGGVGAAGGAGGTAQASSSISPGGAGGGGSGAAGAAGGNIYLRSNYLSIGSLLVTAGGGSGGAAGSGADGYSGYSGRYGGAGADGYTGSTGIDGVIRLDYDLKSGLSSPSSYDASIPYAVFSDAEVLNSSFTYTCCGDDSTEYFWNDSNAFGSVCYNSNYYFESLDTSQSNCEAEGLVWVNNSNYPATYSFTDDGVGSSPEGWLLNNDTAIIVVHSEDGYGKVIEMSHLAGNDQLSKHTIGSFPDSTTDGEEKWEYT